MAFAALLVVGVVAKLGFWALSPFDLSPDEAHYWLWSRQLDLAYYSKGPVVALLIAASTALFGDVAWAVRLPALLSAVAFWCVLYHWLRARFGSGAALAAVALLTSAPYFFTLGAAITTDPPCLLAWVVGMRAAVSALESGRTRDWLATGLAFGLAALTKYSALIAPAGLGLYLLLDPAARPALRTRGPWLAAVVGTASLVPALLWNARHGWINLAHNASHLVDRHGARFAPQHLLELVGAQLGLVGPVALVLLAWAGVRAARRWRAARDPATGVLLALVLPMVAVCVVVSLGRSVYGNWPALVYPGLAALLASQWSGWRQADPRRPHRAWRAAIAVNAVAMVVASPIVLGVNPGFPPLRHPLAKLAGWEELGAEVGRRLELHPQASFVVGHRWDSASALEFQTPGHPPVLNGDWGKRRMNQYDVWDDFPRHRGATGLLVYWRAELPPQVTEHFERVEAVGEPFVVELAGEPLHTWRFYLGHGYDGRPFGTIVRR